MKTDFDNTATASAFSNMLADTLTPKVAVSYLRVSTHEQAERGGGADEGFSIPAQREANKKKAASLGAFVVKEFVDRGESARSANRPELQKMLEYINENKNRVDYVIVHKVDRLARNRGDDVDITRALHRAGVKLVSTTESIDESPSGILLHGIMSSIAEFYSRNLSNEVLKGLREKALNGGTNYHAPLGYKNVHIVDELGREESTVIIDEERAPLIKMAFEYFATGDWIVNDLAEHLARLGLTTLATPRIPSKPMCKKVLTAILHSPYYKGLVYFQGVLYKGKHTPIVDEKTWQKVQDVLASHVNGERTRKHPHFLKSTVYCGHCGSRMIIQQVRNHSGNLYPYFTCAGRQGKRTGCHMKAVLIDEVEYQIEKLYEKMSMSHQFREIFETQLSKQIEEVTESFKAELTKLNLLKEKLERKSKKLLEAHYADAIPLELLKSEQDKISKELLDINDQIEARNSNYGILTDDLKQALDMIEDCGTIYKDAPDKIKRAFNQAIFEKINVYDDHISPEFNEPFDILLDFNNSGVTRTELEKMESDSTDSMQAGNPDQIFFDQGFIKNLLVRVTGLEPAQPCDHKDLNLTRLPIPPHPHILCFFHFYTVKKTENRGGASRFTRNIKSDDKPGFIIKNAAYKQLFSGDPAAQTGPAGTLVRSTGLEPVPLRTRPSNVRVYQFRHDRIGHLSGARIIISSGYGAVNTNLSFFFIKCAGRFDGMLLEDYLLPRPVAQILQAAGRGIGKRVKQQGDVIKTPPVLPRVIQFSRDNGPYSRNSGLRLPLKVLSGTVNSTIPLSYGKYSYC